jgi:hypothetical protein
VSVSAAHSPNEIDDAPRDRTCGPAQRLGLEGDTPVLTEGAAAVLARIVRAHLELANARSAGAA